MKATRERQMTAPTEAEEEDLFAEAIRNQEEIDRGTREPIALLATREDPLVRISALLDQPLIDGIKRIASQHGMGYQTLMRIWLRQRLAQEERQPAKIDNSF